jgi:serine/threonine-protein kinase HipA
MMTLARRAGLDVAEVELVPLSSVQGLPVEVRRDTFASALAVRRFDRHEGVRVHMEDFAQVLDVRPREKYRSANFETIARIIASVASASIGEMIRRLVFDAGIGNGDAHLKNWSLLYPDGVHAVLSPAYDLVSTVQYIPGDDLGLNLARSKRFEDVSLASFRRLRDKARLDTDVGAVVRETAERIRTAWAELRASLPMSEPQKAVIDAQLQSVPAIRGE